ncbi:MAG TPA: agmatine deiminase family protein [Bacteroidia bacterium]
MFSLRNILISIFILMSSLLHSQPDYNKINYLTKPKGIALVYPKDLPLIYETNRSELISFYEDLIRLIPNEIEITLIVKSEKIKQELAGKFTENNLTKRIKCIVLSKTQDIWIKDWAPIFDFKTKAFKKFIYNPFYLSPTKSKPDNISGIELQKKIQNEPWVSIDLVLDGGNFITNENDVIITTNRIIGDNENKSISEIESIIKKEFNNCKLLIVPVEPDDETGHTDGMIRFLTKSDVVVNCYPNDSIHKEANDFLNSVCLELEKALKIKPLRIQSGAIDNTISEGMPSAVGNYINFILLGDVIIMPKYKGQTNKNIELLKTYFRPENIKEIDCTELAKKGGVLNCITWVYY